MHLLIAFGIVIGCVVGGVVALWKKSVFGGLLIGLLVALAWAAVIVGGLMLGGDH